jgi:hypothetical protein
MTLFSLLNCNNNNNNNQNSFLTIWYDILWIFHYHQFFNKLHLCYYTKKLYLNSWTHFNDQFSSRISKPNSVSQRKHII